MENAVEVSFDFLDSLSESIVLFNSKNNEILYLNQSFKNYLYSLTNYKELKTINELLRAIKPVNTYSLINFIDAFLKGNKYNFIQCCRIIKNNQIINSIVRIFKSENLNYHYLFFDFTTKIDNNFISLKSKDLFDEYIHMADNTSKWVWEVDEECRYVKSNFAVYEILGYYPDELIGKTPFELMPKSEAEIIKDKFKAIESAKSNINKLLNIIESKSGELIKVETYGIPIFDEFGKYKGYRGIDYPLTNRFNTPFINKVSSAKSTNNIGDKKINILVINDRRLTTDLLSELLHNYANYFVTTICSIESDNINSVFDKYSPDLIIYFMNFPKFNGLNILKNIVTKNQKIKVIAISECSHPSIIQKILNSNVHGCISILSSKEELI